MRFIHFFSIRREKSCCINLLDFLIEVTRQYAEKPVISSMGGLERAGNTEVILYSYKRKEWWLKRK